MTDTSHRGSAPDAMRHRDEQTGWAAWVVFGGAILIIMGALQLLQGLVAFFDDGFYAVGSDGLVVEVDYTAWGWAHTVIGLISVLVGIGLVVGNMAARIAGVAIAFVSALVNLAFVAAYPLWAVIVIALDVIVIFSIVVHGRELKRP